MGKITETFGKIWKWVLGVIIFLFALLAFTGKRKSSVDTSDLVDKTKNHNDARHAMVDVVKTNEEMKSHVSMAKDLQNRKNEPDNVEDKDLLDHLNRPE